MIINTITLILLQAGLPADAPEIASQAAAEGLSVFDLLIRGGYVMIPIAILWFAALFIFFERYFYIRRTGKMDADFLNQIREKLYKSDVASAAQLCKANPKPMARLLEKGISRLGSPIADIERAIENVAKVEIYKMEKNMNLLSAIAAIAPMFGFLGTVTGMIKAFYNISLADNISIGIIASGIYEKMVTSAAGLIVGVIAYMFFTYLSGMIDRAIHRMEITAIDFLDILHKPVQ